MSERERMNAKILSVSSLTRQMAFNKIIFIEENEYRPRAQKFPLAQ